MDTRIPVCMNVSRPKRLHGGGEGGPKGAWGLWKRRHLCYTRIGVAMDTLRRVLTIHGDVWERLAGRTGEVVWRTPWKGELSWRLWFWGSGALLFRVLRIH